MVNQDLTILFSQKSMIIFLLVMSRVSGMIGTAPLFSTFPIPMQIKAALSALVAFIMYPFVLQHSNFAIPTDLIVMSIYMFKELFIGILIGFATGLVFVGIQIGGQLLSIQMGLAMAEAIDPVSHQNVPVLGQYYLFAASMVFIYLNGHQWLFNAVYGSYKTIPIGLNFDFSAHLIERILFLASQLFSIAFRIIMPIFGLLFVVDIALAFMSKLMPQMNIFMVGLPLKIYIGLICMVFFMPTTAIYLSGIIQNLLEAVRTIFT